MTESLKKSELRKLILWGLEEPEEFSPSLLKQFNDFNPDWKPEEPSKAELDEEIVIPTSDLPREFVKEMTDLLGEKNIDTSAKSRIIYSHGGSIEDIIRIRSGKFSKLAEAVVHPQTEEQIVQLLQICEKYSIAVIPVGGRTSVTRALYFTKKGIALDLSPHMAEVIDLRPDQRTVKVQAGIFGPDLEDALVKEKMTLGHFPQSWEQCSVGGWVASRSAGQNSTLYGKIEDLVITLRIATSKGILEHPLVPACATGPQWLPFFIGSEGTLGVITEATLRIFPSTNDDHRKFASVLFPSFKDGIEALKEICQSEFLPSVARLSDGPETHMYTLLAREGKKPSLKDKIIERFLTSFKKLFQEKRAILLLVYEGNKTLANFL